MRSADSRIGYTWSRGTGLAEVMITVPLTRGSMMKFLPVSSPTALITEGMSALTKLRTTGSALPVWAWACNGGSASASNRTLNVSRREKSRSCFFHVVHRFYCSL